MVHSGLFHDAVTTCEGYASFSRAGINFICKDDCNDGANIELIGDDDGAATGYSDGSSLWESLSHHRHSVVSPLLDDY